MQHLVDTNDFNDKQLIELMHDAKAFKRKMPPIAKLKSRTITHDFLYERDIKL